MFLVVLYSRRTAVRRSPLQTPLASLAGSGAVRILGVPPKPPPKRAAPSLSSPDGPRLCVPLQLATVALFLILLFQDVVLRAAIVVPDSVAASPRKVVGGHIVGVITGTLFSFVLMVPSVETAAEGSRIVLDVMAALSVGTGIFGMVATNTEHPPAAGTALGLVVHGWTASAVAFIVIGAVALSAVRIILRPRLVNLL